jgi:hypothetical protein
MDFLRFQLSAKKKLGRYEIVEKNTYSRGEHAAAKPDSISLHLVRDHLHLYWLRLNKIINTL